MCSCFTRCSCFPLALQQQNFTDLLTDGFRRIKWQCLKFFLSGKLMCVCACSYVRGGRCMCAWPLQPHGLKPNRVLCPCTTPGKNTRVGCLSLLQEIFPTQGLSPGLLHYRQILYHLRHLWLVHSGFPLLFDADPLAGMCVHRQRGTGVWAQNWEHLSEESNDSLWAISGRKAAGSCDRSYRPGTGCRWQKPSLWLLHIPSHLLSTHLWGFKLLVSHENVGSRCLFFLWYHP